MHSSSHKQTHSPEALALMLLLSSVQKNAAPFFSLNYVLFSFTLSNYQEY